MTSVNAAGMDIIGDGNPVGSSLGKDSTEKVGSHGSAAAQATVTSVSAVDQALTALSDKGIINYTGSASTISYGSPLIVFDEDEFEPGEGDGEIVVGVGSGGDFSGVIRSDGLMTFIVNQDDTSGFSEYRWREGGKTSGTSNLMMTLSAGSLSFTGSMAAEGRKIAGAGGASSGAGEDVDVTGVNFVQINPAGGGLRYYNFTNKVDGQILFIDRTGSSNAYIDFNETGPMYWNDAVNDDNAIVRWDSTLSSWYGTKTKGVDV